MVAPSSGKTSSQYDVAVVGAGPAGIFAALELAKSSRLRILVLEKGRDISRRHCPARERGRCAGCVPCAITCGWGGAGAYSDGKLTLSPDVGGWLEEYLPRHVLESLFEDVDRTWRDYGAPQEVFGTNTDALAVWRRKALRHGLRLVQSPLRHVGTERCADLLLNMRRALESRVEVRTETEVQSILTEGGRVTGLRLEDGREVRAAAVIVAPGREGAGWLKAEAANLGLSVVSNAVDIGVRVEVPAFVLEQITADLYEPKLIYTAPHFEDQVRTFCVNPGGEVCRESYGDVVTVNGHSYADASRATLCTNFALLVSTRFTEPFKEPIVYGKSIARLANVLGNDIIVQRLGDLLGGHRTTRERLARGAVRPTLADATPGDLSCVLPYRHLQDVMDMLEALNSLLPGVGGRDTLLYGVEVKFYSSRMELDGTLQTKAAGLYAVGDGAGVTRGIMQASVSGLVAARGVLASFVAATG
ncbi:MAG: FAD-dependent oxidoreductase [Gaiellales bacterium]|nr:FAD-dependent oxidoreductase [Gaiellales bacterium]